MLKIKSLITTLLISILPLSAYAIESVKDIQLETTDGSLINVSPESSGITVYEWFNPGCPFVKKIYKDDYMSKLQEEYIQKGVKWYVINSTNKDHSDFIPKEDRVAFKAKMKIANATMVYDADGTLGTLMKAKTTPNLFVFKDGEQVYSGAIDDAPDTDSDPSKAEKQYLKLAIDSSLAGEKVETERTRPYGCSIKY